MWTYNQQNGHLSRCGELQGVGYSGFGAGRNQAKYEPIPELGPIPRGKWEIHFPSFESQKCGPVCLRLTPCEGTETYSRSGFLIHGDSCNHPGSASHGCIVIARVVRLEIEQSGDPDLQII